MKHIGTIWIFLAVSGLFITAGCSKYKKGELYSYVTPGDSSTYIIRKVARGKGILNKVRKLRQIHQIKKDDYRFIFVSDSSQVAQSRSVLLVHSVLPDFEDDMLSKGFMGAFGTKEEVTYLVVTIPDFERFFRKE
jgi:hypothetical protein